jgi:hypothetical protein
MAVRPPLAVQPLLAVPRLRDVQLTAARPRALGRHALRRLVQSRALRRLVQSRALPLLAATCPALQLPAAPPRALRPAVGHLQAPPRALPGVCRKLGAE